MSVRRKALDLLRDAFWLAGHDLVIRRREAIDRPGINLNVGSGRYAIPGFVSLDLYTDYYHSDESNEFAHFDLRKDAIPYGNETVSNIYASHVLEHIETEHVVRFLGECARVLVLGGTLRIASPDARFLFEASRFDNDYWAWRAPWFSGKHAIPGLGKPHRLDYLVRELATPRCRYYRHHVPELVVCGDELEGLKYEEIVARLLPGLHFREEHPGDHINIWDFARLHELGSDAGFHHVVCSKPGASVSRAMQGRDFDLTHPQMSLYVDMVKE